MCAAQVGYVSVLQKLVVCVVHKMVYVTLCVLLALFG